MSRVYDRTDAREILKNLKLPENLKDKDFWVHVVQNAPKAARKKLSSTRATEPRPLHVALSWPPRRLSRAHLVQCRATRGVGKSKPWQSADPAASVSLSKSRRPSIPHPRRSVVGSGPWKPTSSQCRPVRAAGFVPSAAPESPRYTARSNGR